MPSPRRPHRSGLCNRHPLLGLGLMTALIATASTAASAVEETQDPLAWLDEIEGPRALAWVQEQNDRSLKVLQQDPRYGGYYKTALEVLQGKTEGAATDSWDPLTSPAGWLYGSSHEGWYYALFRNERHPRGLWRRMRLEPFLQTLRSQNLKSDDPNAPQWEPMLDIDALSQAEGTLWSFYRADCLGSRCLIWLTEREKLVWSMREFDLTSRTFVKDGFALPPIQAQQATWKDENTLYVITDFGPGSLSRRSGPMQLREWRRGTPLREATVRFSNEPKEAESTLSVKTEISDTGERKILLMQVSQAKYRQYSVLDAKGQQVPLFQPPTAALVGLYRGEWLFNLIEDWSDSKRQWKANTLLSIPDAQITRPHPQVRPVLAVAPGEVWSREVSITAHGVFTTTLQKVRGRLWRLTFDGERWQREPIALPDQGVIRAMALDRQSRTILATYQDLVHPITAYALDLSRRKVAVTRLRSAATPFPTERYLSEQFEAVSADGTRVPYFVARPKAFKYNGRAPTLLHAYGNRGKMMLPDYEELRSRLWLAQGGVFVLANVRGGSELGPQWYVTKTARRHTYEDFIAVAEDLIRRNITSPRHLGTWGHSMGGCLMAVTLNMRPELFNAAIMQNPLLDQIGWDASTDNAIYNSGSLDIPEERAFLEQTSPYQNLRKRTPFPIPLLATTTTDTGVTPAMARKYGARLASFGMPFLYYEAEEGGHDMGSTPEQRALWAAVQYTYLARQLQ